MSAVRCYRCGKPIKAGAAVPLELNTKTGIFTSKGMPESESQGWFDFGPECGPKADGQRVEQQSGGWYENDMHRF